MPGSSWQWLSRNTTTTNSSSKAVRRWTSDGRCTEGWAPTSCRSLEPCGCRCRCRRCRLRAAPVPPSLPLPPVFLPRHRTVIVGPSASLNHRLCQSVFPPPPRDERLPASCAWHGLLGGGCEGCCVRASLLLSQCAVLPVCRCEAFPLSIIFWGG